MPMTAAQKRANVKAHRNLAETRIVDRYLQALDQQIALAQELEELTAELPTLEAGFIKAAKSYAKRKDVDRATFIEFGVSEKILRKAGITA